MAAEIASATQTGIVEGTPTYWVDRPGQVPAHVPSADPADVISAAEALLRP